MSSSDQMNVFDKWVWGIASLVYRPHRSGWLRVSWSDAVFFSRVWISGAIAFPAMLLLQSHPFTWSLLARLEYFVRGPIPADLTVLHFWLDYLPLFFLTVIVFSFLQWRTRRVSASTAAEIDFRHRWRLRASAVLGLIVVIASSFAINVVAEPAVYTISPDHNFEGPFVEVKDTSNRVYYTTDVDSSRAWLVGSFLHSVRLLVDHPAKAVRLSRDSGAYVLTIPVYEPYARIGELGDRLSMLSTDLNFLVDAKIRPVGVFLTEDGEQETVDLN